MLKIKRLLWRLFCALIRIITNRLYFMEELSCSDSNRTIKDTQSRNAPPIVTHRRTISVHAEGEAKCLPDLFTFTITVTHTKEKLDEAQSSVKRRTNYILQVLRNHGYHDNNIRLMEEVTKFEALNKVKCVIIVDGKEIGKLLAARNILTEKMDSSVQCSNIECTYTAEHKGKKKEEAFKVAVCQAKCKAQSVTQCLGVSLGAVLSLVEERQEERNEREREENLDIIEQMSFSYVSNVRATFEVNPIKNNVRKK